MTLQSNNMSKSIMEMQALKEKAIAYYSQNGVPKKMEEILNSMVIDNPDDVFGHVVSNSRIVLTGWTMHYLIM